MDSMHWTEAEAHFLIRNSAEGIDEHKREKLSRRFL